MILSHATLCWIGIVLAYGLIVVRDVTIIQSRHVMKLELLQGESRDRGP